MQSEELVSNLIIPVHLSAVSNLIIQTIHYDNGFNSEHKSRVIRIKLIQFCFNDYFEDAAELVTVMVRHETIRLLQLKQSLVHSPAIIFVSFTDF